MISLRVMKPSGSGPLYAEPAAAQRSEETAQGARCGTAEKIAASAGRVSCGLPHGRRRRHFSGRLGLVIAGRHGGANARGSLASVPDHMVKGHAQPYVCSPSLAPLHVEMILSLVQQSR